MSLKLYLNLLGDKKIVTVEEIIAESTICDLKTKVAAQINSESKILVLMYCGKPLEDHVSLANSGVTNGAMIHVSKLTEKVANTIQPPSEAAIQEMVLAFRTAMMNPAFKTTILMQHLIQSDFIENMKVASPGLAEDPIALSLLYDWELLLYFADPTTAKKLIREHPCLLDVASAIAAAVHQVPAKAGAARPWLGDEDEEMEEDDDEEEATAEGGARASGLANGGGASAITRSQLSAALAALTRSSRTRAPSTVPTNLPPTVSSSASQPRTFISSEMFNAALSQAMASIPSNNNVAPQATQSSPRPSSSRVANEEADLRQRYGTHLSQMRELGIADDSLSLRALQATNGDVQAAVNLIFAGLMGDE